MSSTPVSKEVQDRLNLATQQAQAAGAQTAPATPVISDTVAGQLEETIRRILAEKNPPKIAPKEPDWSQVTEAEAMNLDAPIYIPVIEHEIPQYLDVRLADPEYLTVWVNKDQRRVSEMLATGYELLKKEHIAKDFPLPLKFNSEGVYEYADVVAMRVHKRIKFGKARRVVELSTGQLRGAAARDRAIKRLENEVIQNDPGLDRAFNKGEMSFF